MANKLNLEFVGMEQLIAKLTNVGGSLESAADAALKQTFGTVTRSVTAATSTSMYNFKRTGKTAGSILSTPKVEKQGMTFSVPVGFDIGNGGLASIFLMHGTPTITPDRNLYNSIYGTKIRKIVQEEQREVFQKHIERAMK